MYKVLLTLLLSGIAIHSFAQNTNGVLIDATNSTSRNDAAAFEINAQTQTAPARYGAFLLPRVNSTADITGTSLVAGLQVYQTGGTAGIYYYNGSAWVLIAASSGSGFIENRAVDNVFTTGQSANFDITGSGEIGGTFKVAGNVGIGATGPVEALEIYRNGSNPVQLFHSGSVASYKLGNDASVFKIAAMDNGYGGHTGNFAANDAQVISMNTFGNVGIGNVSPAHQLSVGTATADGQPVTIRGYSNSPTSWKGGAAFGFSNAAVIMGQLNDVAQIGGHNGALSAWADLAINSAGGNVGVGTVSPDQKFEVEGGRIRITQTTGGVLELTNSTLPKTNYVFTDGSGHLNARTDAAANHLLLQAGGIQGNVGVGATAPQEKLDVNGNIQIGYNTANTSTISKRFATAHSAANVPSILQMGVDDGCGVMGMHIHNVRNGANTLNDQYITFTTHAGGISCGERMRITETGVVRVANLAGTGSRFVVADASGNLSAGTGTGSGIVTGVGAATRVAFWNSTSDLSSNANLYWDNTNSRLGVGTATPAGKIHAVTDNSDGNVGTWGNGQFVVGQAAASGATSGGVALSYSTTNNTGYISSLSPTTAWRDLGFRANDYIFYNAVTERMRLTSAGNLGIGIVNPGAFRLNVFGDARIGETAVRHYLDIASSEYPEIRFTTPSFTSDMRIGMAHAANATYGIANGDWYVYSPGVNRMDLIVQRAGGISMAFGGGNVGIGTNAAGAKLHIGAFNDNHLLLTSSNNAYGWRVDTRDNGGGSVPLRIFRRTNSVDTEVLTILNQNGNVGLNTVTPGARLDIEGGAFLGYESDVTNFGALLKSGFYQDGGNLVTGDVPDQSTGWSHLITARHSNTGNNHQLQIAGSFSVNDRLFFRKIAAGNIADNPAWNEFATRGTNQFGGQTTNGASHYQWEGATYRNPTDHTPTMLIRADNSTTGFNGFRPALTLYNFNGAQNSTVGLVFASNEAAGVGNTVNLSGIMGYKESAGTNGAWSQGGLLFFTKNMGTRIDAMKISAAGRIDVLQATGGDSYFTGLHDPTDAAGRAQVVLSSSYSDLVIASSQDNPSHGSTLTFATYNPANPTGDYRKWVINQGNWGARSQFLDFGYGSNIPNPHSAINGGNNTMSLDGINRRVGIRTDNPATNLHVHEGTAYTGTALATGTDRPGILLSGTYPHLVIASSVNNPNHAGTLSFWHNNNGGATTSMWNMGASDAGFSIGYGTNNGNPHLGLENWTAPSVMSLETNGFVGIGTISPENTLHVNRVSTDNRAVAQFTSPGNNSWGYVLNVRTTGAGNDGAKILFRSRDAKHWGIGGNDGGNNNFVINEDGGDGQYGSGFGTQRYIIEPGGTTHISPNGGHTYVATNQSWGWCHDCCTWDWGSSCGWPDSWLYGNCGTCGRSVNHRMTVNGGIAAYSFWDWSDSKIKSDVSTISNALDIITRLRGVSYKLIDPKEDGMSNYSKEKDFNRLGLGPQIGFIAQEVKDILPQVVKELEIKDPADSTKIEQRLGMEYGKITALLVEGMKEQQKQIEELKAEIAQLKSPGSKASFIWTKEEILKENILMLENILNKLEEDEQKNLENFIAELRHSKDITLKQQTVINYYKSKYAMK